MHFRPSWAARSIDGSTLRRLSLVSCTVLLVLVGLECLVRLVLWNATLSPPIFASGEGRIRLKPDTSISARIGSQTVQITIDGEGNRLTPGANPAGRPLHLIGDSQVFGWGLSDGETVAARLQAQLGPSVRVVNHGTPGWGPLEYAALLNSLPPGEAAIVLESEESDTGDAFGLYTRSIVCGYLVGSPEPWSHFPCMLLDSRVLQGVLALVEVLGAQRHLGPLELSPSTRVASKVLERRMQTLYRQILERSGRRLWFTMIPWRGRYDAQWRQSSIPPISETRADTAMAERDGSKMLEAFASTHPSVALYLDEDTHLSAQGAALMAGRLASLVGDSLERR
jgi:hypothetical protein